MVVVAAAACVPIVGWTQQGGSAPVQSKDAAKAAESASSASEAARRVARFLASSHPLDPQLQLRRGLSLAEEGRADEAINIFTRLTIEHPELPEPYNNLAVLYAGEGQYDKARQSLESALRTHPSYSVAFSNLSEVYSQLASEAYAKALPATAASAAAPPRLAMIREVAPALAKGPTETTEPAIAPTRAPAPAVAIDAAAQSAAASAARYPTAPPQAPTIATLAKAAPPAVAPASSASAASSVTAAAKPAASVEAAAAQAAAAQVHAAVQAWARAWSRKDLDAYYAAYTPDFDGGKTRQAWLAERRARIAGKKQISVTVSGVEVVVEGERATARFQQSYVSDRLKVSGSKTLRFVKSAEKWLISDENVES
jgi:ketosteroid isomerase-like protein